MFDINDVCKVELVYEGFKIFFENVLYCDGIFIVVFMIVLIDGKDMEISELFGNFILQVGMKVGGMGYENGGVLFFIVGFLFEISYFDVVYIDGFLFGLFCYF